MDHSLLVDAIIYGFLYPTIPKQPGKLDYVPIQYIHRLLTTNVALIESLRGGGHNGYLGVVLVVTQYALVSQVSFVRPTNPGQTPTILAWTASFDEKNRI